MKNDFDRLVQNHQIVWRHSNVSTQEEGVQNGLKRRWILPREAREEGWFPTMRKDRRSSLAEYLKFEQIKEHPGSHNLKSSWTLCANLYFPFFNRLDIFAAFLFDNVSNKIRFVRKAHLEYAHPVYTPTKLLNEPETGNRGSGQTSPDLAIEFETEGHDKGLLLVENKYTEHSFYACSGRAKVNGNCIPKKCLDFSLIKSNPERECYQMNWANDERKNRKYWSHIRFSNFGMRILKFCPAAVAGYQLFRQQALAEALLKMNEFKVVVSAVAWDERNVSLQSSLTTTGVEDFRKWGDLFDGKASFASWTHQSFVKWIQDHDHSGEWADWLRYIKDRYQY